MTSNIYYKSNYIPRRKCIVNQSEINKLAKEKYISTHNIINVIYSEINLIIVSKRNIIKINFSQLKSSFSHFPNILFKKIGSIWIE